MAPPLTEICVESLSRAIAAERGGADRIELCSDLSSGGVTPSADLMRGVRREVRIPIHVLIRPRADHDVSTDSDFETMKHEIAQAKKLAMDGIVLGILDKSGRVDRKRTATLVKLADPLPVTFHRAFDSCPDLPTALEAVIESGAQRILTSGGRSRATDGLAALSRLVSSAGNRIAIMPGGGVRAANVKRILRATRATEIHTSLVVANSHRDGSSGSPRKPADRDGADFEARVRKFVQVARSLSSDPVYPT